MASQKKPALIKNSKLIKEYSYSKGSLQLNFSLYIDNSSYLREYRTMLEEAMDDIDKDIAGMQN